MSNYSLKKLLVPTEDSAELLSFAFPNGPDVAPKQSEFSVTFMVGGKINVIKHTTPNGASDDVSDCASTAGEPESRQDGRRSVM
jgi:hypothetical protein